MGHRIRLKLESTIIPASRSKAPKEYLDLRFWWLHELRRMRMARRIAGANVKKEMKMAQRELARLRDTYL